MSFQVEKGQIYGFLGPNGAGKSTTMNIMTGYLSATEGEVIINGYSIFDEPEKAKKCIGYLPEQPPLYMDMTPLEYLNFVAELKKIPNKEKDQMMADIMKLVKIVDVKDRLIKNLSKGYKQRVGLAQAIIGYPEIIILDEPTSAMDPSAEGKMYDNILSVLRKNGVILVSHRIASARLSDRILVLQNGTIVEDGSHDQLIKRKGLYYDLYDSQAKWYYKGV